MNNAGQNIGAVSGVTGVVAGTGITCTPNPISRTGTVSLSEGVVQAITAAQTSTQNITADQQSTRIEGVFQVNDFAADPFFVVDPTATLVVHGPYVSVSSLQPISENSTIGTMAVPFDNVYTRNVTTPGTNLNALAASVSNHTSFIADLTSLTQNQSASPDFTSFAGRVTADQFVKQNGTNNQFLMADGSVLENSNSNANSNIYLYTFSTATVAPPNSGEVRFNSSTNVSTTTMWLNHLTRESVDIHQFLSLITTLSVVYVQQEDNAENYIKFNVNTTPVLPEPHVSIELNVTVLEGAGTGLTNFGADAKIFVSIFTNDREIDTRLSLVEARTANINSFSTQTIFGGNIDVDNNRIINLPSEPVASGDAVSATYLQSQLGALFTQAQGEFLSIAAATLNYALISSLTDYLTKIEASYLYLSQADALLYLTSAQASLQYLSIGDAKNFYLSQVDAVAFFLTQSSATETYLRQNDAAQLYATQLALTDGLAAKLDTSTAASTYLTQDNAANTYATQLALTNGLSTKLDTSTAASTYLTQTNASATYATLSSQNIARQAKQITSVVTNGLTETIMTVSPTFGSYTWTDTAVGQSRKWKIQGVQSRSNFSATFTIRLRTNGTLNTTWILPASPSVAVTNQPFTLELTQVRQVSNQLFYYARFISPEATTAGYSLFTSQNQTGGVVGLNVSGAYTITVQSNLASGTLTFLHVDVSAVLS